MTTESITVILLCELISLRAKGLAGPDVAGRIAVMRFQLVGSRDSGMYYGMAKCRGLLADDVEYLRCNQIFEGVKGMLRELSRLRP
jgi:hypothetical protein